MVTYGIRNGICKVHLSILGCSVTPRVRKRYKRRLRPSEIPKGLGTWWNVIAANWYHQNCLEVPQSTKCIHVLGTTVFSYNNSNQRYKTYQ